MSRRWWAVVVVAVLAVAAVTVGIATSRAQGSATLQSLSVAQLLAKVAAAPQSTTAVSGDVSWTNGLIPGSDLTGLLGGQSSAPSSLSGLALGGSGRLWLQQGGGLRLESQGSGSDFVVVAGKDGLWSYSSATGTATRYAPPAGASAGTPTLSPSPQASPADTLAAIAAGLQRFASTGTVTMGPQVTVAGRPSYTLVMTPASATTTIGSVRVAIDARTFVPLRVQVFAKGDTTAVLSAGFTSVSYGRVAGSLFTFTPPTGATVRHTPLPSPQGLLRAANGPHKGAAHATALTLAQATAAAARDGLALTAPVQSSLPASLAFEGAAVSPSAKGHGAVAVLHYGNGFGSVALVESQGASGASATLPQQLAGLPRGLSERTSVAGTTAYGLSTSLFNVVAWQHGKVTVVAAGMVPKATLQAFVAAVR
jgi:outer membrane lipoprotein-sorting protein